MPEGAETAYRVMVENMNEGAMMLDPERTVVFVNTRMTAMLGVSAASLVGRPVGDFVSATDRDSFGELLRGAPADHTSHGDFTLVRPDGAEIQVSVSCAPLVLEDGRLTCLIVTDLTERKKTEEQLGELNRDLERTVERRTAQLEQRRRELERTNAELDASRSTYQELLEAANSVIVRWDAARKILSVNPYGLRFFEYTAEELVGSDIATILPASEGEAAGVLDALLDDTSKAPDRYTNPLPAESVRKSGEIGWLKWAHKALRDEQGNIREVLSIGNDITELMAAEQALRDSRNKLKLLNENLETLIVRRTRQVRALSKALTVAEQRERLRFSQVLHDDLQQILFSARMVLDESRQELPETARAAGRDIRRVLELLDRAAYTARSLALELNPPVLKGEGLDAALEWLARHMENRYGLCICVDVPKRMTVGETDRILIVQLVRELLFNVVKHARARDVVVSGSRTRERLRITVEDRGVGFDVQEVRRRGIRTAGMGIFSIEERLRLFGGTLDIESTPGKGTRATITMPLSDGGVRA